jgi:CubicO group peptidase (beta-lactamase class C family)
MSPVFDVLSVSIGHRYYPKCIRGERSTRSSILLSVILLSNRQHEKPAGIRFLNYSRVVGSKLPQTFVVRIMFTLDFFRLVFLIFLVVSSASAPLAQEAVSIQKSGFSKLTSSEIDLKIEALDRAIEEARLKWGVPGLSVAIVHKDQVKLCKGYGVKEQGQSQSVDRDTLFAIASNSKAFTATALAMLVDEKKLRWDDRVQDHLPWFQLNDSSVSREMRVVDLLCHRSGLGTFSGDLLWYGTPFTPREILEKCRHLKPEGLFRDHYGYSNVMFLAAGLVVEKASGQPWQTFVESRILKPLQMNRSVTSTRDLLGRGNFATPHKTMTNDSEPLPWVNWDTMAAAGGIISSAHDMSQWMRLQLGRGTIDGTKIVSPERLHEMWQPHIAIRTPLTNPPRVVPTHFRAYGLGWSLSDYAGRKLVAHGGGYDGMYSHQMLVPDEEFGVIVLSNSMTSLPNTLCWMAVDSVCGVEAADRSEENLKKFQESRTEFRKRIDAEIQQRVKDTKPSHPMADYAKTFHCPMMGDAVVKLDSDRLVLEIRANPELVADLQHLHYDTFVLKWRTKFAWFDEGTVHFVANAHGDFVRLDLNVPNEDLWFHELNFTRQ